MPTSNVSDVYFHGECDIRCQYLEVTCKRSSLIKGIALSILDVQGWEVPPN